MPTSLRRSASAPAAMETTSLPRWAISIADMPASCQLTSSHLAFSSTSTGMVAGPAPKLKMRAAGLTLSIGPAVFLAAGLGGVTAPALSQGRGRAVAVAIPVAVGLVLVAVHDVL